MNATISLENILQMLSSLSKSNKRWLAEHLIEQATKDEEVATSNLSDEEFFKDLFSTPYDNPMTAEEAKRIIRESRCSGKTRHIKPLSDYTQEPA